MTGLADGSITIKTNVDQSGFTNGRKQIESGLNGIKSSLKSLATVAITVFSARAIINFGKETVKAASDLQNAMRGVKSIVDGQGKSFADAQSFIQDYISDGLIPATDAATAYKNLALRGYDQKQIEQVMIALKNSAAYGRQASLTMGQAVASATEGLKNENSILVDNAGVTKNVAKMWDDYARSIGTTAASLTKQQKIQAEVNGILYETRFQIGDAAKITDSYSGQILKLQFSLYNLKVAIGNAIMPIVQAILPGLNAIINGLTKIANLFAQVVTAIFGKQAKQQDQVAGSASSAAAAQNELADATNKAAKAAKEALAPFDQLNILQSDAGSSGSGDSASPDVGGGVSTPIISDDIGLGVEVSQDIQRVVDTVKSIITDLKNFIKTAFEPSFSAWGKAFESLKNPVKNAVTGIKKSITDLWKNAFAPYYTYLLTDWIPSIVNGFSTTFAPIFADIMPVALDEFVKDFQFTCTQIDSFIKDIFQPAMEFMKTVALDVFDGIKKAWDEHGAGILTKFQEFKQGVRDLWTSLYENVIKPILTYIGDMFSWLWDKHLKPLWDKISNFVGSVAEFLLALWNNVLKPFLQYLVEKWGPPIAGVIGFLGNVIGTFVGWISDIIGGIIQMLSGLLNFLTGVFTGDWDKAWKGIKEIVEGWWNAIWGVIKGIINLLIDGINFLWTGAYRAAKNIAEKFTNGALGKLLGLDKLPPIPDTPPLIPKLAKGAIVTAPTVAQIGERGREAVLPLENNTSWMDTLADKIAGRVSVAVAGAAGSGGDIYVFLDSDQISKTIERRASRRNLRTNGR